MPSLIKVGVHVKAELAKITNPYEKIAMCTDIFEIRKDVAKIEQRYFYMKLGIFSHFFHFASS